MNKLKLLAIAVVAAAMVAVAGLAAPTASAQPRLGVCDGLFRQYIVAERMVDLFWARGDVFSYFYWDHVATDYYERAMDCYRSL